MAAFLSEVLTLSKPALKRRPMSFGFYPVAFPVGVHIRNVFEILNMTGFRRCFSRCGEVEKMFLLPNVKKKVFCRGVFSANLKFFLFFFLRLVSSLGLL